MILRTKFVLLFFLVILSKPGQAQCGDSGNRLFDQTFLLIANGEPGTDYPSVTDEQIMKNTFELVYGQNTLTTEKKLDLIYAVSLTRYPARNYSSYVLDLFLAEDERVSSDENKLYLLPFLFEYHSRYGTIRKFVLSFPSEFHLESLTPAQKDLNGVLYEKLNALKMSDKSDSEIVGVTNGTLFISDYVKSTDFLSKYPCLKR